MAARLLVLLTAFAAPSVSAIAIHTGGSGAAGTAAAAAAVAVKRDVDVDRTVTSEQARLQANVQKAMLALYLENARMVEERSNKTQANKTKKAAPSPFERLQSFGREDTAAELTEASIYESNAMIDQIERAVVSETKRSMFRALTRLRGVTISSYDGMANGQSSNIDEYAHNTQWRDTHNLEHLAEREGNVQTWAFPPTTHERDYAYQQRTQGASGSQQQPPQQLEAINADS